MPLHSSLGNKSETPSQKKKKENDNFCRGGNFSGHGSFGGSHGGGRYGSNGMAIMDLVMMEAILEVVEATMILAITTISLQILDP